MAKRIIFPSTRERQVGDREMRLGRATFFLLGVMGSDMGIEWGISLSLLLSIVESINLPCLV